MPAIPEHWQPGDSVVLRNTGFFVGETWGTPHVVIEDTDERVVLYRPEGTSWSVWHFDQQRFRDVAPTRMDMLRLMFPCAPYAVELFFHTGAGEPYSDFAHLDGRFRGWKLNVEAPFIRTEHGFDTTDDVLDIFVEPDGRWHWTDESELAFGVQHGGYSPEDQQRFFDTAASVELHIAAGAAPFDDEWVDWQPPQGLALPSLPDGWHHLPGADISLSAGKRYDHWRDGLEVADVQRVADEWREAVRRNRQRPETRRFRSGLRRKA